MQEARSMHSTDQILCYAVEVYGHCSNLHYSGERFSPQQLSMLPAGKESPAACTTAKQESCATPQGFI